MDRGWGVPDPNGIYLLGNFNKRNTGKQDDGRSVYVLAALAVKVPPKIRLCIILEKSHMGIC